MSKVPNRDAFSRNGQGQPVTRIQFTANVYDTNLTGNGYDRAMTMVHVAQFDAVNAVQGGYTPYALNVAAPWASPEAAAAPTSQAIGKWRISP